MIDGRKESHLKLDFFCGTCRVGIVSSLPMTIVLPWLMAAGTWIIIGVVTLAVGLDVPLASHRSPSGKTKLMTADPTEVRLRSHLHVR